MEISQVRDTRPACSVRHAFIGETTMLELYDSKLTRVLWYRCRLVRMLYQCCHRRSMQLAYSRDNTDDMLHFLNFSDLVNPAIYANPRRSERARV